MGLFRDRAAEKAAKASADRKVARMRGVSNKVNAGRSIPKAEAPYTCGQRHYDGSSCASTVRGGVCPCSQCS